MESLFPDIIFEVFTEIVKWFWRLIMPFIIGILGKKYYSWDLPKVLTYCMVAIAAGLVISAYMPDWTPPKHKIRNWLDNGGFSVKSIEKEDMKFGYIATDTSGYETFIYKDNKQDSNVYIASNITMVGNLAKLYFGLNKKQRSKFISEVHMELFRLKLEVSTRIVENKQIINTSLPFIFTDSLTELEFLKKVFLVRTGIRLIEIKTEQLKFLSSN